MNEANLIQQICTSVSSVHGMKIRVGCPNRVIMLLWFISIFRGLVLIGLNYEQT